jgi:putative ABC transport system permease protein
MEFAKIQSIFTNSDMGFLLQNIAMALKELFSNKLRTFLSLLGVTIGVFCIISVLTVFSSLQSNIQNNMQTLGSNVLYLGKFAWIPEEKGEYQWWKYKARPVCNLKELKLIEKNVSTASYAALNYSDEQQNISFGSTQAEGVGLFAVTYHFNKLQPIDIANGRYFTMGEMQSGRSNGIILGADVATQLFGERIDPISKMVDVGDRKFLVIGVLKKQGKTMTGFDFDGGGIISYSFHNSYKNMDGQMGNGFVDPMLMVKTKTNASMTEMKDEIRSVLRAHRKLRPRDADSFAFNQLDSITNSINAIFANFNIFGWIIGLFSLIVGSFGIANIMFVSVKERTRLIGIKKAIGAKSFSIMLEFLIESILLCIMGGLIGIGLVMVLGQILEGPLGFPVRLSFNHFVLGVSISVIVGILSGFIPARRASGLDPVVAIRS